MAGKCILNAFSCWLSAFLIAEGIAMHECVMWVSSCKYIAHAMCYLSSYKYIAHSRMCYLSSCKYIAHSRMCYLSSCQNVLFELVEE